MSDSTDLCARRRGRWAVTLLLLGLVVAFVPGLAAGDRSVPTSSGTWDVAVFGVASGTHSFAPVGSNHFGLRSAAERTTTIVDDSYPLASLSELVRGSVAWAVSAATLLLAPLLFLWWRRSATGFGRAAGVASCFAAAGAVCALVLTRPDCEFVSPAAIWCFVPLGGALMAAAFLVAPPPRVRDE
jgi:hypothetical protein